MKMSSKEEWLISRDSNKNLLEKKRKQILDELKNRFNASDKDIFEFSYLLTDLQHLQHNVDFFEDCADLCDE